MKFFLNHEVRYISENKRFEGNDTHKQIDVGRNAYHVFDEKILVAGYNPKFLFEPTKETRIKKSGSGIFKWKI